MGEFDESRTVTGASSKWEAGPAIAPGDCIGRYTIRSRIGAGGMGEVYAAEDSELGRTVALKLIRPDRLARSPTARLRLIREAQALARLHHPNVVCVHDVGGAGDQLFVAMELVAGPTLHDWLHAAERSWREVLAVFLAAGRGLAVAHGAGIVHRDFKPSNVIVGQDRVVVVDFGLARAGEEEPAAPDPGPSPGGGVLNASLTMTGEYLGTPLYMAPEQKGGGEVSAQADQYSFCVSLEEALGGAHRSADGHPVPLKPDVPGWVSDALHRGLSEDPAARWPSMEALLAELGRDRQKGPRRALLVLGGVALAAVAAWGMLRPAGADPCAGGPTRLAGVWDAPTQEAVGKAFLASGLPFAAATWNGVQARLDAYASRWTGAYAETCRATRVEGRQSDSLFDLRMACLDRRRAVLASLTALWLRGVDSPALEHADEAVSGLQALNECTDSRALAERSTPPASPGLATLARAVRTRVDAARALLLAYRLPEARREATEARRMADDAGWVLLRAEAAEAEGLAMSRLGDPAAEVPLLDAARLAGEARDDRLAAQALTELVRVVDLKVPGRALLAANIAEAMVARTGDDLLRAELLKVRAQALLNEGKTDEARSATMRARELLTDSLGPGDRQTLEALALLVQVERARGNFPSARKLGEENLAQTIALLGPEHPQVVQSLVALAAAVTDGSDPAAAVAYLRRALAINEKVTGPDSAATATTLGGLGTAERVRGNLEVSQGLLERALAIRERVYGPDHSLVASSLANLGDLRRKQGRFPEARELLLRALGIFTRAHGPAHEKVALVMHKLGHVERDRGDLAAALGWYQRALDLRRSVLGESHSMTLYSMSLVGGVLAELDRCAQARPLLTAASEGLEKAVGALHADYIGTLMPLARCDLKEGRLAEAIARLERELALDARSSHDALDTGTSRLLLGRALWAQGHHKAAVAAVRAAESDLASNLEGPRVLAEARAWLRDHAAVALGPP